LAGVLFLAAAFSPAAKALPRPLDWGVLMVLLYEIPSLWLSRFPANGVASARIVCAAVLFYFAFRVASSMLEKMLLVSVLVGIGGLALTWIAVTRFDGQFHAMQTAGFSNVVAFRARLIVPGPRWVLGEWFTLVLSTLPFAFAVTVWCWLERRRAFAAVAAVVPIFIIAALLLPCSRAVFWSIVVFVVAAAGMSAAYRVFRGKTTVLLATVVLAVAGAVLLTENAIYPGVAGAYLLRQSSQVRSTEGRLTIWKRSAEIFKLAPVWGVGSGNTPLFLASSADQEETTGFASRTYSLPLQVLTEKGAIGAALYLSVLILAGWEAHRKLRNPKISPQMKGLTCCLVAGVAAVLFRELTYSSLLEHAATAMLFTMSLALLAAGETA
jgi:O-antigen ligase